VFTTLVDLFIVFPFFKIPQWIGFFLIKKANGKGADTTRLQRMADISKTQT
jgi:hypothetical protein